MINNAFIHEYGNSKLEPEHLDVKSVLESRNISVNLFTQKRLDRNQLTLDKNTLVVGEIPIVLKALKKIGITNINHNTYPTCLHYLLKRKIWTSTIKDIIQNINSNAFEGIFVKPKDIFKKFTGFIVYSSSDFYKFQDASHKTLLYCSEIVQWKSEYRIYVTDGKIVGIRNYAGDENVKLNMNEVYQAINVLEKSDERTAGYGIDFGVLSNGETALIEWNDGFSLGSYDLEKEKYTDLLIARWLELMHQIN